MLQLRVSEILKKKKKSKYWLAKNLGMHYVSFNKMINNQTVSIRFDTLDRMASILDVPVGDLFLQTKDDSTI